MTSSPLVLFALIGGAASQSSSSSANGVLPSIHYFGLGYNLLRGNPHALSGRQDPGDQQSVLQLSYSENLLVGSWLRPDATSGQEVHNCRTDFSSSEIRGMHSYTSSLEVSVSADYEGWGAAFSASTDYKHVESGTQHQDSIYMQSSATCTVYSVMADTFTPPKLTDNFVTGVMALPQTYTSANAHEFNFFIETFGTHVVMGADFGGIWGQLSEFSSNDYYRMVGDDLDVQAAASYSGLISAGVQVGSQTHQTNAETFARTASSQALFHKGGTYSQDRDTWIGSVRANPMPVLYHLQPLDEVLQSRFMPASVDAAGLAALPARRAGLQAALRAYCNLLLTQGYLSSCAAPTPDPIPTPYESLWLSWPYNYQPAASSYVDHACPSYSYISTMKWREQDGYGLVDLQATCSDGTSLRWTNNNHGNWNSLLSCSTGFNRLQAKEQWGYGIINVQASCFGQGTCPVTGGADCARDSVGHAVTNSSQCEAKGCCWDASTEADRTRVCAQSEGETCRCGGRVYYGRKYVSGRPGNGQTTTFQQMTSTAVNHKAVEEQVTCSHDQMGGDPLVGYYKWCYCVESSCHHRQASPEWRSSNTNSNGGWKTAQACPWNAPVLVGFEVLYQDGYGIVNYRPKCSNGNSFRRLTANVLV